MKLNAIAVLGGATIGGWLLATMLTGKKSDTPPPPPPGCPTPLFAVGDSVETNTGVVGVITGGRCDTTTLTWFYTLDITGSTEWMETLLTAYTPPGNSAPVAVNHEYSTPQDTVLDIPAPGLLVGCSDPDGDNITVEAIDIISGIPGVQGADSWEDGRFKLTPKAGFSGIIKFWYTVTDGALVSAKATVTITVTAGPPPPPPGCPTPLFAVGDSVETNTGVVGVITVMRCNLTPLTWLYGLDTTGNIGWREDQLERYTPLDCPTPLFAVGDSVESAYGVGIITGRKCDDQFGAWYYTLDITGDNQWLLEDILSPGPVPIENCPTPLFAVGEYVTVTNGASGIILEMRCEATLTWSYTLDTHIGLWYAEDMLIANNPNDCPTPLFALGDYLLSATNKRGYVIVMHCDAAQGWRYALDYVLGSRSWFAESDLSAPLPHPGCSTTPLFEIGDRAQNAPNNNDGSIGIITGRKCDAQFGVWLYTLDITFSFWRHERELSRPADEAAPRGGSLQRGDLVGFGDNRVGYILSSQVAQEDARLHDSGLPGWGSSRAILSQQMTIVTRPPEGALTLAYEDMDGPHATPVSGAPLPLGTWVRVQEGNGQLARLRWNPRNGWEYLVDVFKGTVAALQYVVDEATHAGGWGSSRAILSQQMTIVTRPPEGALTLAYEDMDGPHATPVSGAPLPLGTWVRVQEGNGQLARLRWNPRNGWEYLVDVFKPVTVRAADVRMM